MTGIDLRLNGDVVRDDGTRRIRADPDMLFATIERFGDRPAILIDGNTYLSYATLADRADAFAATLGESRMLVAIEGRNAIDPLIAYVGAMRAGHPVMLIPPAAAAEHSPILDLYRPDAAMRMDTDGAWILDRQDIGQRPLHPDLALLLSTSGSTGSAKLVRLSSSAVAANAHSIADYLGIEPADRAITSLPIHYSYGLSVINSHLQVGAVVVLTDRSVVSDEFWEVARATGATSFAGVPHTYDLLERIGFRTGSVPSLRLMTQAGGRLPRERVLDHATRAAEAGVKFIVMYGQTEATARMAYLPWEHVLGNPDAVGIAIPRGSFRLVDEEGGTIEAPDRIGELVYTGPNVMMGYATGPEDLARGAELDELRTGDLACCDTAGLYRIVGRMSRFLKLFGLRIGLDDIEAMLHQRGHTTVATGDDQTLAVLFVGEADLDSERAWLAEKLKLPLAAIMVAQGAEMPTLDSGKPDYGAILRAARDNTAAESVAGASADADGGVARIFADAFPRVTATPDDSFVTMGGDSLNYVSVSIRLEDLLGTLPDQWEQRSLAQLQELADAAPVTRRLWSWRPIDSDVVLRALAILAVVVNHASDKLVVGGGANVLLMLVGFNMSRFQFDALVDGRGVRVLRAFATRIILPYYAILIAYMLVKREVEVPSLLLVSNYFGRYATLLEPYWFMELLFQTMVIIVALFCVPAVRRVVRRAPWTAGCIMFAVTFAIAGVAAAALPTLEHQHRTPENLLWLVALGWCLHQASNQARRVTVSAMLAAILALGLAQVPYSPTSLGISHLAWIAVSAGLLIWVGRLPVPTILHGTLAATAAASFYIYLAHVLPVHIVRYILHREALVPIILVSFAAGLTVARMGELIQTMLVRRPMADRSDGIQLPER